VLFWVMVGIAFWVVVACGARAPAFHRSLLRLQRGLLAEALPSAPTGCAVDEPSERRPSVYWVEAVSLPARDGRRESARIATTAGAE